MNDNILNLLDETEPLQNGEIWKANSVGDKLGGVCVNRRQVKSEFADRMCTVLDIKSAIDGKDYTVWADTMLERLIQQKNVQPGDHVALRFEGKKKGKRGREYNSWTLVCQKGSAVLSVNNGSGSDGESVGAAENESGGEDESESGYPQGR